MKRKEWPAPGVLRFGVRGFMGTLHAPHPASACICILERKTLRRAILEPTLRCHAKLHADTWCTTQRSCMRPSRPAHSVVVYDLPHCCKIYSGLMQCSFSESVACQDFIMTCCSLLNFGTFTCGFHFVYCVDLLAKLELEVQHVRQLRPSAEFDTP